MQFQTLVYDAAHDHLWRNWVMVKPRAKTMRLWRRFSQIEKPDNTEKRKIMQLLDTFIENEPLKQKAVS